MIESRTMTRYSVVCGACGTNGPETHYRSHAKDAALIAGWHIKTEWNGVEYISAITCPDCKGTRQIGEDGKAE